MVDFGNDVISANVSLFDLYAYEENFNISGVLVNRHYNFLITFSGVRQMVNSLEKLFNELNFPMASVEERYFNKKEEKHFSLPNMRGLHEDEYQQEKPAFVLHVQFRQGSTWQGTLRWVEKGKTKRFRSELEMMGLLMEAMELGEDQLVTK